MGLYVNVEQIIRISAALRMSALQAGVTRKQVLFSNLRERMKPLHIFCQM
jgi:hypothetical protein